MELKSMLTVQDRLRSHSELVIIVRRGTMGELWNASFGVAAAASWSYMVVNDSFVSMRAEALPENRRMPSARVFAECRISSTRQRYYLPRAYQKALGEQLALSGINLCRVPASWHSAKPIFAECLK